MNKAEASKLAARISADGHSYAIRHYGHGSWAVEIDGGRVFHSTEAYDNWAEAQKFYAATAEADKAAYTDSE